MVRELRATGRERPWNVSGMVIMPSHRRRPSRPFTSKNSKSLVRDKAERLLLLALLEFIERLVRHWMS